jgi:aminopeptidase-like protein
MDRTPTIDLHGLVRELFPINRSLTGDGVRETLRIVSRNIPVVVREVQSGTKVLDWEVPREWNIRRAAIKSLDGEAIVDFATSNLHVVGYSKPVRGEITRTELARHVHTLPDQPDLIPYRTGYYADDWGFCIQHRLWETMQDDFYHVEIDSDLREGNLTYGEFFVPGESDDEVLISCHVCHPSLANDNLSGIAVATALAMNRDKRRGRLGYRFLYLPATIGAITWLAKNEQHLGNIKHGLVLTCLGDDSGFHYKKSRKGATIDRAVAHVLQHCGVGYTILPFNPYGYDERQFCSPGYDLPVGCLMRGVHGTFAEYHTSADNVDFVTPRCLDQSYGVLEELLDVLDGDLVYRRIDGRGEPQLGRRGLYRAIAGQREAGGPTQMDLLWLLNLADGHHSLLDIALQAEVPFARVQAAAKLALEAELISQT